MSRAVGRPAGRVARVAWPAAIYAGLAVVNLFVLFPLYSMVTTSIRPPAATMTVPVQWWPAAPTLEAYGNIWLGRPYGRYFLNSTLVAAATTGVSISLAALAGYGFSRYRFRGASALLMGMVATQMIPSILLLITYFKVVSWVGLYNTLTALVLAYTSFVLPFTTWLLKGYFDSVPIELDEAALIDGCSPFAGFVRVILPVALPGITATSIYAFLLAWNEFIFAYVLTDSSEKYTISVGIAHFFGEYSVAWNELMAAGMVAAVPPIVLYMFTPRFLVSGLTAGALK
jgi:ABC-type glycerol-3-phosphate transport system permease component